VVRAVVLASDPLMPLSIKENIERLTEVKEKAKGGSGKGSIQQTPRKNGRKRHT